MAKKEGCSAVDLYLEMVKLALTGALQEDSDHILGGRPGEGGWRQRLANRLADLAGTFDIQLTRRHTYDPELRRRGLDRPARAESMIGLRRMDNVRHCVETAIRDDVPGDLIEAGVWRGGATIFMRAVLKAHDETTRKVWVADSFEGLPPPNASSYPADRDDPHHTMSELKVGVDQVRHNFRRYQLLDDQVKFLVGWFADTLPTAPIDALAVMRLDGDMYESTIQSLEALYPKLSPGGFCIIDDYGLLPGAAQAVQDYRNRFQISDEICEIDGVGVYWRKGSGPPLDHRDIMSQEPALSATEDGRGR